MGKPRVWKPSCGVWGRWGAGFLEQTGSDWAEGYRQVGPIALTRPMPCKEDA